MITIRIGDDQLRLSGDLGHDAAASAMWICCFPIKGAAAINQSINRWGSRRESEAAALMKDEKDEKSGRNVN